MVGIENFKRKRGSYEGDCEAVKEKAMDGLKKRKYGLLAACLAALIAFIIFVASQRLFSEYSFLIHDLNAQYVHFIKLFLRSLFEEGTMDYTFDVGMGTPTVPLYAFYCLSPFNLIYLLIKDVSTASAVVVILKYALAAYTFWWFEQRVLRQDNAVSAAFAVCYALSGYSIAFYYNILYTDGIYMLPVIVTLVVGYVKTGSWRRLVLAYAYQFVVMFYCGYIIGIFSFLILLLTMVWEYGRDWKIYLISLLKFMGIVVWAALIGAVVLLPTAGYLLGNSIDSVSSFGELRLTLLDIYHNLFLGEMQSVNVIFPLTYSGLIVLFLVPVYFLQRRVCRKEKILFAVPIVFLLVCSLWQPLYILMHGFNAPNCFGFRFSFFYSFILLAIACRAWELSEETCVWKYYVLAVVNIILYYIIYVLQKNKLSEETLSSSILGWELNAIFLILYAALLSWRKAEGDKKRLLQWILLACAGVELFLNGFMYNTWQGNTRNAIINHKYILQLTDQMIQEELEQIRQDVQFRGERTGFRIQCTDISTPGYSASCGYRGLGYFSTVENKSLRDALFRLGYFTSTSLCLDYGGTAVTRMLFSQDYLIHYYLDQPEGMVQVEWNEKCLSLGFMVSEGIKEYRIQSENPFENQNLLLQLMTGEEITCFLPYEGEILLRSDNMIMAREEENSRYLILMDDSELKQGSISFELGAESPLPLYAYFSEDEGIRNDLSPRLVSGAKGAVGWIASDLLSCPRVFILEKNEAGQYEAEIIMNEKTLATYFFNQYYFYYYNEEQLQEAYEILAEHQMKITGIEGDTIKAVVTADSDSPVLFTSIPYDDGWKIMVDGERIETFPVLDGAFLAVELTPGEHTLEFTYDSGINRIGRIFSVIGLLTYIVVVWISERREKFDGTNRKTEEI